MSTADGTDIDDIAAALPAHGGQHRAADSISAKEIDFELPPGFLNGSIFNGSGKPHPCVIHHDIQPALAVEHRSQPHCSTESSSVTSAVNMVGLPAAGPLWEATRREVP